MAVTAEIYAGYHFEHETEGLEEFLSQAARDGVTLQLLEVDEFTNYPKYRATHASGTKDGLTAWLEDAGYDVAQLEIDDAFSGELPASLEELVETLQDARSALLGSSSVAPALVEIDVAIALATELRDAK